MGTIKKVLKKVIKKLISNNKVLHVPAQLPYDPIGENWGETDKPIAFMFGFNPWKREHMSKFFQEYRTAYVFGNTDFNRLKDVFNRTNEKVFIVWGFKEPNGLLDYAKQNNIVVYRVEDGFVRSVGLGAAHTLPLSIAVDSRTLYFNSREASDLEVMLETFDFSKEKDLLEQAEKCKNMLINMGVSKYNHAARTNIEEIYGPKTKKRILVIGQVEDDASIRYGCSRKLTNNDLVWAAYNENPDAEIIYKPHPDVLEGYRKAYSNPMDVAHISKVVTEPLGLVDALQTIDHVYTITSLAGFEALIRGISVTCFGAPFYSGWGLTEDRQNTNRRFRKLTINELFAIAYIKYPRYLDPDTGKSIDLEEAIYLLNNMIAKNTAQNALAKIQAHRYSEGEILFRTALKQVTDQKLITEWNLELAKVNNKQGKYEQAMEICEQFISTLKSKPEKIKFMLEKGNALLGLGNLPTAVKLFHATLEEDRTVDNLERLMEYYWEIEGPTERVLDLVDELLISFSNLPKDKLMKYAAVYNHAGFLSKAVQVVNRLNEVEEAEKNSIEKPTYLALAASLDLKNTADINQVSYERRVYNHLINSERTFENLVFESKDDFCIVGSGEISGQGQVIDQKKLVIRVDREKDLNYTDSGTKTHVLIKNSKDTQLLEKVQAYHPLQLVLLSDVVPQHRVINGADMFNYYFDRNIKVQTFPQAYYQELVNKLEAIPSELLKVLYWIYKIQGPIAKNSLIGIEESIFTKAEREVFKGIIK